MNRFVAALAMGAVVAMAGVFMWRADKTAPTVTATGAVAGTLAEPNIAEIRSAIESANQKWLAGMLAGDVTGVIGNYADDAMVMMPMTPTWNGRAAIEAGMKEWLGMAKVNDAKGATVDVMAGGDLAVETGTFEFTTTMKGAKPVTDKGKYVTVWKRQSDGSWKIVRDINNSDGTPPATAK